MGKIIIRIKMPARYRLACQAAGLRGFLYLIGVLASCWSCAAQAPVLTAPRIGGNNFEFILVGESNAPYVIESSATLQNWTSITTNRAREGARLIQSPALEAPRFFRAYRSPEPSFQHAVAAHEGISFNGSNSWVDSFDSTNPLYSTNGLYDPARRRAHGHLAVNYGDISLANVKVMGVLFRSPLGGVMLGADTSVGDAAWVSVNDGIQPGHNVAGTAVYLPDASIPFTNAFTPSGGWCGTNFYSYILSGGNDFTLSSFAGGSVLVVGHERWRVQNTFRLGRMDTITILPGASLQLYVAASSAILGGGGVVNQTGNATNFQFYGLPGNTNVLLATNSLLGVIYAPTAHFSFISTNGSNHLTGAVVSRTATVSGAGQIHYDESLGLLGPWH